ncbi:ATP-binding protein [uncultured Tessaracoccus sp.]|uniref:ATP-binding protein n=1 Tax=uncultured Tessaracoccus sp. TaxID=905023 RepID=UPI002618DA83|nr:ATP-binding protein [uncultured Tessaracoccus sp.]
MSVTFARDPIEERTRLLLDRLEAGEAVGDPDESEHVDLKEEAGRRGPGGEVLPGEPHNEVAAAKLAEAAACMANSDGGGALIVGVSDLGELIGMRLDGGWLRQRIWELTDRLLTVAVRDVEVRSVRLLVVRVPQALQPVPFRKKLR